MPCLPRGNTRSRGDWENELLMFLGSRVGAGQGERNSACPASPCRPLT